MLLPYLVLVCVVAQLNAVMYGLNHFWWPSLEPVLLNVVWIACLWCGCRCIESPTAKIYAVAVAIVASGFFQLAAPLPTLRPLGFRYVSDWRLADGRLAEIGKAVFAVTIGLSVTQLNSLLDGLTAWGFTRPESAGTHSLAAGRARLSAGTGDRLGPLLRRSGSTSSRWACSAWRWERCCFPFCRGTRPKIGWTSCARIWSRGLKLVLFISVPASAGLVLLARPLTILLFEHGSFDAEAVRQTTGMVRMFGCAVWAYCGIPDRAPRLLRRRRPPSARW